MLGGLPGVTLTRLHLFYNLTTPTAATVAMSSHVNKRAKLLSKDEARWIAARASGEKRHAGVISRQQSRRGLGATDGFAFVPHTVAVFPIGHLLGIGTENSPKQQGREIPSPTSESYLTNSTDCDPQRDNAAKF